MPKQVAKVHGPFDDSQVQPQALVGFHKPGGLGPQFFLVLMKDREVLGNGASRHGQLNG
ncbi:hypothetical protein BO1005MUT1_180127 [Hyphomicrobiales bacterium]|nr:hypothetical protein BO1005MUT1_180127 [Hyphomicrobiales bacterium]